jgi:uncharacterized protein
MNIKERIQFDFIAAMKNKDTIAKSALSGVKAKITESEKSNGNRELSDDEVIKVINKAIKQREESAKIYSEAKRLDLESKELLELNVLMGYMPAQMDKSEIETEIRDILAKLSSVVTNKNALIGKTMGEFNKNYQGRADLKVVLSIINSLIEEEKNHGTV